jgi:hypothetical protein
MGTGALSPGVKLTIHLQLMPRSRKCESIPPLPHMPSWGRKILPYVFFMADDKIQVIRGNLIPDSYNEVTERNSITIHVLRNKM